jgi:hypothetical protein
MSASIAGSSQNGVWRCSATRTAGMSNRHRPTYPTVSWTTFRTSPEPCASTCQFSNRTAWTQYATTPRRSKTRCRKTPRFRGSSASMHTRSLNTSCGAILSEALERLAATVVPRCVEQRRSAPGYVALVVRQNLRMAVHGEHDRGDTGPGTRATRPRTGQLRTEPPALNRDGDAGGSAWGPGG